MAVEELFVNAYDSAKPGWLEIGDSPYLHDTVLDYVRAGSSNLECGDFDFADSAVGAGTINSVKIAIYGKRIKHNLFPMGRVRVYIWDGSAWQDVGLMQHAQTEQWLEIDVSAHIDSWVKIDGCRLYLKSELVVNTELRMIKAKLVIDYTPVVPPPPPAKPLINKPLVNPILVNIPLIRLIKRFKC